MRLPFENLLAGSARLYGWTFVAEQGEHAEGHLIRPDGTVRDANSLPRGWWESKDVLDDLDEEIQRKIRSRYPVRNTIFENTRRAVLYQDGELAFEADLSHSGQIADLLNRFYSHRDAQIRDFEDAMRDFEQRVPDLARGLAKKIEQAHRDNARFQEAFLTFFALCRLSLNPNIRREAVDEMLVQHLLTERLIRTIFDNPEFTRRNAVAVEVEHVIDALVSESFSRTEYLHGLDSFYIAIENAARVTRDFGEKQHFLNSVYERFFRGYSVRVADTHGIIYTPQPIVNFICASVVEILKAEFGLSISSPGVNMIDPCTGTGNFIVNLMRRMSRRDLPRVYRDQLFANEVMLMPYYIASLNIEHTYQELIGKYEGFDGLCFVDTLDIPAKGQAHIFSEVNTDRINRERDAPITVVVGNPPYNVGQLNENDNNKNRKYPVIDRSVSCTYTRDSEAVNKNSLSDPYVKFFRWATDRLDGRDGLVCFVSNNGFLDNAAFDGFRKHLGDDFKSIFHFDLKGNARTTGERRRKEGGNIFHDLIRVGVGITLAIRKENPRRPGIWYYGVSDYGKAEEKLAQLSSFKSHERVPWAQLQPNRKNAWLIPDCASQFEEFTAIDDVFATHSVGVKTNRDDVVYGFQSDELVLRVREFIEEYNSEVDRYRRSGRDIKVDDFVRYQRIKWSRDLKLDLRRHRHAEFAAEKVRRSLYRPYTKKFLFFDRILNEEVYKNFEIFPYQQSTNRLICCTIDRQIAFSALMTDAIPSHAPGGRPGQCFPIVVYPVDGSDPHDNVTDAALKRFRAHYADSMITKEEIFNYIYAMLQHQGYRDTFAESLKRELPRIPFAPDFRAFATAGRELSRLHLEYERLEPWPLQFVDDPSRPPDFAVKNKMRLSRNKTAVVVNPSLTVFGVPAACFEYRIGNRSALEWIINQYQVTEDPVTRAKSDPNSRDDPEYVVRLIGQVVRVSMETRDIVNALPTDFGHRG
jgi:predicted helicase